jgi:hypothetical protein
MVHKYLYQTILSRTVKEKSSFKHLTYSKQFKLNTEKNTHFPSLSFLNTTIYIHLKETVTYARLRTFTSFCSLLSITISV